MKKLTAVASGDFGDTDDVASVAHRNNFYNNGFFYKFGSGTYWYLNLSMAADMCRGCLGQEYVFRSSIGSKSTSWKTKHCQPPGFCFWLSTKPTLNNFARLKSVFPENVLNNTLIEIRGGYGRTNFKKFFYWDFKNYYKYCNP